MQDRNTHINEETEKCRSMAAVMLFLLGKDRKTEHNTHFCMPLEPVFTRDCGSGVHFMDEPVNGLDPQGIVEIRELILRLNRERQITVLISSHILDELSKIATHYGFIDGGRILKEVSKAELEAACRKCIHVEVTDTKVLAHILHTANVDHKIHSSTSAEIYAKVNISKLAAELAKENCEILSMQEKDEDLESYFFSLVGGSSHE